MSVKAGAQSKARVDAGLKKKKADEKLEKVENDTVDPVEGEASRLIGGGGALPTDCLRDEAFGGEEDREDGPDAAPAPRANAAPTDPAATDDAVGGAAVGAVGEAGGPGETIEGVAGEDILIDFPEAAEDAPFGTLEPGADETSDILAGGWDEDTTSIRDITITSSSEPVDPLGETVEDAGEALGSPGANIEEATGEAILVDPAGVAGDAVEHMYDPAVNAVLEDGAEPPSFMEDTIEGGGLGDDVGNEDVVEHMDDPVF
jgi:hypothetical protein